VLESADQALRHKPRQLSVMSSVVRSPPPKSSVQKIGGAEPSQIVTTEKQLTGDVRTVVHSKSRDSSSKHERRHRRHHHYGSSREKHSTSSHPPVRGLRGSGEQLLITVTEDVPGPAATHSDDQAQYRAAFAERKESILDEDQFEPDYDEGEMAVEVEHKSRKESTAEDGKHSRRKHRHSRHTSQSDSASKSRKHKKHKRSKKHKSKGKKQKNE